MRKLPQWVGMALFASWLLGSASAANSEVSEQRGGHFQWARLKSSYKYWDRHPQAENIIINFIRQQTTLNVDSKWAAADVKDLESLTRYPFLYAEGVQGIDSEAERRNLREYLERGGFLFIEGCINTTEVNPDPDRFYQLQVQGLEATLPGVEIRELPVGHEIFNCFFHLPNGIPRTYQENRFDPRLAKYGLYGIYYRDRMVGALDLAGLKCGWSYPRIPDQKNECMQMVVNIYVFALTN